MAGEVFLVDMPVEEYLRGAVGYPVADNALDSILFKRKVAAGALASSLTERELDLCAADVYLWCAAAPGERNDTVDGDGGWKHAEGGWKASASEKRELRALAGYLYGKWGERLPGRSSMRITQFGIR